MIRFICPGCQKTLSAPDGSEGGQVTCPSCQQRLVVPGTAGGEPENLPDLELTDPLPEERLDERPSRREPLRGDDEDRPSRRGRSREDDPDEDDRPSRRGRRPRDDEDEDEDDRPSRRGRRGRRGDGCPFCDSPARPIFREDISTAGWVVFVVMILFCWPLCFIGLLMKETKTICVDCGRQI